MQSTPSNTMARCTMSMRMIPSIVPRGKTHFRQAMHRHLIVPQERCRKAISAWSAPAAYQPGVLARNTDKHAFVDELLGAKAASGKTFSEIAEQIGLTNTYTAQLFYNQAQLKEATAHALVEAVPGLTPHHVARMQLPPMRSYDEALLQEPHVYRIHEAVMHYAEAIKAIMSEELGDGIMSAIDMFATVKVIEGKGGEKRLCLTLNGKFMPHVEQHAADNTA